MEHDTRGDPGLVLGSAVQLRADVIELEDPKRNKGSDTPIDAPTESRRKRGIRAQAETAGYLGNCRTSAERIL